jgi:lipopolysaccharide/colanic/teichoic acid biosynthesis glycosyltransferase
VNRAFDVAIAGLGLVVASPLLAAAALAIKLEDRGPVLYRQTRVGKDGQDFEVLKLRSMLVGAERQGAGFAVDRGDARITRVGRLLRRTSIDELPQLWNVLTGTMSLVGPRPPLPSEVVNYDIWHRRRLSMKPGITGLWQVEARHEPDFDRWVEHDLLYIDGWTIWLDLKILARTLPALVAHGGR